MKARFFGLVFVAFAAVCTNSALGDGAECTSRKIQTAKVGNVIIVGNERTRDEVIRKALPFYPGQLLRYPDLRTAERNLEKLGIFLVDKGKGIRPTVTVLESDGEFKDILVQVQEMPTGSLLFGAGINSDGQFIVSMTLEERNFDPYRFPTCLADLVEGRAFRGGGRKMRLDVFQVILPGNLSLLRFYLDKPKVERTAN
jgi:outer membrane protein assembly factor BamA